MSVEWTKRKYVPSEDEDALVYLWTKSYERSEEGKARGAFVPGPDSPRDNPAIRAASRAMWAEQAPLVEVLLRSVDVEVICDPARPLRTAEGPAVIWAFAATTGDVVHYVCVKRDIAKVIGADIVRDLLGSRLERPCTFTHQLVEMLPPDRYSGPPCGVRVPRNWGWDSLWLPRRLVGIRQVAGENEDVRWGKVA